ncbi:hypothetical protein OSTOST_18872, partial [Ostertagia ostertagi]
WTNEDRRSRIDRRARRHRVAVRSADSTASDSDTADDAPLLASGSQTVRIDMPASEKPASPHDRFPKERSKALALIYTAGFRRCAERDCVVIRSMSGVPETPPLPDITFSLIPYYKDGLKICEYIRLASFASVLLLMLFHRTQLRKFPFRQFSPRFVSDSPRRWRILHIFSWLVALVGVVFLVISRGHYTLDVILSYFICTRVFWNYHTMVAHPTIRVTINSESSPQGLLVTPLLPLMIARVEADTATIRLSVADGSNAICVPTTGSERTNRVVQCQKASRADR